MTVVLTVATAIAVAVLVWAEWRSSGARLAAKPAASAGFVAVAVAGEAASFPYGRWVVVALVLSALGDVALLSRGARWFLLGLGSFLLAHLAYAAGFVTRGLAVPPLAIAGVALAVVAAGVVRWLLPTVPAELRVPVVAYAAVITAMVALAIGTSAQDAAGLIVVGAVAFYLSDLAVARDRFVAPGVINRLWGLPTYYFAQLALAWSAI